MLDRRGIGRVSWSMLDWAIFRGLDGRGLILDERFEVGDGA